MIRLWHKPETPWYAVAKYDEDDEIVEWFILPTDLFAKDVMSAYSMVKNFDCYGKYADKPAGEFDESDHNIVATYAPITKDSSNVRFSFYPQGLPE